MSDLTYPFLTRFYELAGKQVTEPTFNWMVKQARAAAGGAAYPNNATLPDDHVEEGVGDPQVYAKAYNACVRLLGKHLADSVARQIVGEAEVSDDLSVTEVDLAGLTIEQEALFRWGLVHTQEIYGKGKEPPEYVPKAKRKAWISMFNAILKSTSDESKSFAITNAHFVEKK